MSVCALRSNAPRLLANTFTNEAAVTRLYTTAVVDPDMMTGTGTDKLDEELKTAKPFRQMPGPLCLPYIGSVLSFRIGKNRDLSRYHHSLKANYEKYGDIVRQKITKNSTVHLFNPEYSKALVDYEWKEPSIPPLLEVIQRYRKLKGSPLGLFNANGPEWYRVRSAVQKMMLRPKEISIYVPLVNRVAEDYVGRFKDHMNSNSEIPGFEQLTKKWSMESGGSACFGYRLGYLKNQPQKEADRMIEANVNIFEISRKLKFSLPIYQALNTPSWRKLIEEEDFVVDTIGNYVKRTLGLIHTEVDGGLSDTKTYTFLKTLLSKPELTVQDINILSLSMLVDGLQTTVPNLYFNMYCLAANPRAQQKVVDEFRAAMPKGGDVTLDVLNKLSYLKACFKEAHRLYPLRMDQSRIPERDIAIGGYRIPKGTRVEMNNFVLYKDPKHFRNPETFEPERWLRQKDMDFIHPHLLKPFGHSPRMCAGRRIVEQETYVALVKMLQKYVLGWNGPPMEQEFKMVMIPKGPLKFTFKDRTS